MATREQLRAKNTAYARRRRERKDDAARQGQRTCPVRQGKHGVCGGLLESTVGMGGRVLTSCPRCERRKAGVCRDCPRRVEGRIGSARRCAVCKRTERSRAADRYRARHPNYLDKQTARRLKDAAERTPRYLRRLEVKRLWRERNVARIKLSKRKWRLNPDRPNGYSTREKFEAYHRVYRQEHAEHRRELARQQYYREHPDRPHPVCACGCETAIPWDGSGRPGKWLREHRPYTHSLTAEETLMKAAARAVAMLERAAENVRKKIAGTKKLQEELAGLEKAIEQLRPLVPAGEVDAPKVRRSRKAA